MLRKVVRLVAANAIYLKEKWLHPFPASDTRENADFTRENGNTIVLE